MDIHESVEIVKYLSARHSRTVKREPQKKFINELSGKSSKRTCSPRNEKWRKSSQPSICIEFKKWFSEINGNETSTVVIVLLEQSSTQSYYLHAVRAEDELAGNPRKRRLARYNVHRRRKGIK
jgi:hypothetical protein